MLTDEHEGGEFVLLEQRPRAQSRAHVVRPPRGAFVIFPTRERPKQGERGYYRVGMRHGVGTVTRGSSDRVGHHLPRRPLMQLTLDHVILRAADPRRALARLEEQGLPVLEPVTKVGPLESGIARAGAIDVEVLRVGGDGPAQAQGYGIGFTADEPLEAVADELRRRGLAVSIPLPGRAADRRWRVIHVAGLLPEPFPAPVSSKPPSGAVAALTRAAIKIPGMAALGARRAGDSMVVVTEYRFDVAAWRARAAAGPAALAVEVGTYGHEPAWAALGPVAGTPLQLDGRSHGVQRVLLEGGVSVP